jgi:hypothetical protein
MIRNLARSGLEKHLLQTKLNMIPSKYTGLYNLTYINLGPVVVNFKGKIFWQLGTLTFSLTLTLYFDSYFTLTFPLFSTFEIFHIFKVGQKIFVVNILHLNE